MHLILDFGNTRAKFAVFDAGALCQTGDIDSLPTLENELIKNYPTLDQVVFVDVSGIQTKASIEQYFSLLKVFSMDDLELPFSSEYETPETLGQDRIALVAAAVAKFPNQNCLIIDAGSCITYDLLMTKNTYLGGSISPGIKMRFKSLHHFTGKLPLVSATQDTPRVGKSTKTAIESGVIHGIVHEIEGQIHYFSKKINPLTVILTGGDAQLLSKSLKNTIFAESNFLAEGLDYLLNYNKN